MTERTLPKVLQGSNLHVSHVEYFQKLKCISTNLYLVRNGREKSEISIGSQSFLQRLGTRDGGWDGNGNI